MTAGSTEDLDRYRLPRTVVPSRYDLVLEPDLAAATFSGTASIAVTVVEPVDEIVLNALDLELDARLVGPNGTVLEAEVTLDHETERALLDLEAAAAPGEWRLEISFRGVLNDQLVGFYRSTYTDDDGVEQALAVTQMESTHARRAFPCFDEPDLKAVFAVTLMVEAGLTALSNGAEIEREAAEDGRERVRFAATMPMSTYLVAFVVGRLELTEPVLSEGGVPIRIAHPPGKGDQTATALDAARFALDFFAEWFDLPYPGDKLDLVAVPDFAFGAMENLGCVTFREVLLLIDPDTATQPELQRLVDVVAHELAHMWFGDLVTMGWWEGIWLNEAFATFMEMLATDAYRPQWRRWVDFGLSRTAAFDVDALASTRPIEYPVISPADAEGMFDLLTYEKGAAVLRMLEQYLGPDTFRAGIRRYLRAHAYANTVTTDLWDAIEAEADEPVRRIMGTWIDQGGFPVVGLAHEPGRSRVRLTQSRFRYLDDDGAGAPLWAVPVVLRAGRDGATTEHRALLDADTVEVDLGGPADWVLANVDGSGFYRVRYAPEARAALVATAAEDLAPIERYGLVDDAWALVLADELDAPAFLDVLDGLAPAETDLSVWQRIAAALGDLDRLLPDAAHPALAARIRALTAPARERLGGHAAPDDDERTRQLRATLLGLVARLGDDTGALDALRAEHDRAVAGSVDVDPALVAAAVDAIAHHGGPAEFAAFVERFGTAATPQEQQRYLYALADFRGDGEAARLREMTLTDDVRTQNAAFVLRRALRNRAQGAATWRFLHERWDEVTARLPSMTVVRMLEGVSVVSDPVRAAEIEAFFAEHPLPQATATLAQHLESMRVHVALRDRESDRLVAALPR